MKSLRAIVSILVLTAFSAAFAQIAVPPPPRPVNDAPANVAVLKLLQVGMPESVVLDKIRAITDKFDTSVDALIMLKQAGVTDAELKAILTQDTAPAQPAAQPPAAAPTTSGPSLAETMKFIQEKLNGIGKVAFVFSNQNKSNGSTWTETRTNEISNVVADQNQCRISYHRLAAAKGNTYKDENNVFSLRDVQQIVVKPEEQDQNDYEAKHGDPNILVTSTSPSITALMINRPHGEENFFLFTDANLADRVAKALTHAVELCGGGSKD
ncbi:MAG: hypothetical protein ABSC77_10040 [Terracidiphilus sp.]|jgi:hypothetical protein